jgi:uncharacterized protein (UPF0276 family)
VNFTADSRLCDPIPARAGIGLKPQHYKKILEEQPDLGWFEVHPENYMGAGGPPHRYLEEIRANYPLSMHGVGLSLGSAGSLDKEHLKALKILVDRYQPGLVSEHLSWSHGQEVFMNDLLPLFYTEESLKIVVDHVSEVQDYLGRQILIENPSTYLSLKDNVMSETEFLTAVARQSGCGLLLDVNNVYVCARNHGFDPMAYVSEISPELVGEIHLAGHQVFDIQGTELRIDDHGSAVCEDVWDLHAHALSLLGSRPMLIEWDTDVPELSVLLSEAAKADHLAVQAEGQRLVEAV